MQTTQQFSLFPETLKSQVYLDLDIELSSQLNIDLIPGQAGWPGLVLHKTLLLQ